MIKVEINTTEPINTVWENWIEPKHIVNWNFASEGWECPKAENDFKVGGKFNYVMASKDGSEQFNFTGTYTEINQKELIRFKLDDGRKVDVHFEEKDGHTVVTQVFESEKTHSEDLQKQGWQAILDNFKAYIEK